MNTKPLLSKNEKEEIDYKKLYVPLSYDYMFKHIFGTEKNIKFANYLVKTLNLGGKVIRVHKGEEIDKISYENKTYKTDVILELEDMSVINMEAYRYLTKEGLIKSSQYICRLYSHDLNIKDKYSKVRRFNQINIVKKNYITNPGYKEYVLTSKEGEPIIEDMLKMYIITLDQKGMKKYNLNKEQKELLALLGAETREEAEEAVKDNKILKEVLEAMDHFLKGTFDNVGGISHEFRVEQEKQAIREDYETMLKAKEQQLEAKDNQLEKQHQQLEKQKQSKITMIKNMFNKGLSIKDISEVSNISSTEIQKILHI